MSWKKERNNFSFPDVATIFELLGWLTGVDIDIKGFYDNVDHAKLLKKCGH
jgi:hypothetical protein